LLDTFGCPEEFRKIRPSDTLSDTTQFSLRDLLIAWREVVTNPASACDRKICFEAVLLIASFDGDPTREGGTQ